MGAFSCRNLKLNIGGAFLGKIERLTLGAFLGNYLTHKMVAPLGKNFILKIGAFLGENLTHNMVFFRQKFCAYHGGLLRQKFSA